MDLYILNFQIDSCEWQEVFFIITLISVILINCFAAIFQSSVFGLAAELPQKYSGGYMAGQVGSFEMTNRDKNI